nr:MAG TPA: hypothetical protein [Caudoviricetes sp.]
MSYISKYVESLMSKKDKLKNSVTTKSAYYTIGNTVIRISDHFSVNLGGWNIDIVNPLNAKTVYLVKVKEGPQILTFNLAGVKTFISNYLYIREIKALNKEVQTNISNNKKKVEKAKAEVVVTKTPLTCIYGNQKVWCDFWNEVSQRVPKYSNVMNAAKRTEVYLAFKGATVEVVAEKLKEAIEAGILYKESSASELKKFWGAK